MLRTLASTGRILAQTWPALLAWYLGGTLVRAAVLALAAPIGPQSPLAALLIVPVAVLARLISYVGMFLVLRRAMRTYRSLADGDVSESTFRELASEFSRVLVASVLPFFFLYSLIGLLAADLSDYARSAFRYSLGSENGVIDVGDGPLVVVVIVVAFAARQLLKVFGAKLPRWVAVVEIYLEATWIFVALSGVAAVFGDLTAWIADRQVVHWIDEGREALRSLWTPIRLGIDGIEWATPVAAQLVLLPLAWLLIAGVVYTRSLESARHERIISRRFEARLRLGLQRLPAIVRNRSRLVTDEWDDIGGPLALSGRLIAWAGIRDLAVFLCAYALLFAAGQWFSRLLYAAIGAHDSLWWYTVNPILDAAIFLVVEPVRVVLLAAAFDWCLARWAHRRRAGANGAQASANLSSTVDSPVSVKSTVAVP
jgi:hypothetical protein